MLALFVFAHPDDESFTSGGAIIQLVKKGSEVSLICATKGEAGELGNPPVCTRNDLAKVREQELRNASEILGISDIHFLDYKDAELDKVPFVELSEKILEIIKAKKPDEIYTFGKSGLTNHPDHIIISKAATNAFNKSLETSEKPVSLFYVVNLESELGKLKDTDLEYKAFGKMKGVAEKEIIKIDIQEELTQKIDALKCHKTQNKDWERFLKSGNKIDLNFEYFQKVN